MKTDRRVSTRKKFSTGGDPFAKDLHRKEFRILMTSLWYQKLALYFPRKALMFVQGIKSCFGAFLGGVCTVFNFQKKNFFSIFFTKKSIFFRRLPLGPSFEFFRNSFCIHLLNPWTKSCTSPGGSAGKKKDRG